MRPPIGQMAAWAREQLAALRAEGRRAGADGRPAARHAAARRAGEGADRPATGAAARRADVGPRRHRRGRSSCGYVQQAAASRRSPSCTSAIGSARSSTSPAPHRAAATARRTARTPRRTCGPRTSVDPHGGHVARRRVPAQAGSTHDTEVGSSRPTNWSGPASDLPSFSCRRARSSAWPAPRATANGNCSVPSAGWSKAHGTTGVRRPLAAARVGAARAGQRRAVPERRSGAGLGVLRARRQAERRHPGAAPVLPRRPDLRAGRAHGGELRRRAPRRGDAVDRATHPVPVGRQPAEGGGGALVPVPRRVLLSTSRRRASTPGPGCRSTTPSGRRPSRAWPSSSTSSDALELAGLCDRVLVVSRRAGRPGAARRRAHRGEHRRQLRAGHHDGLRRPTGGGQRCAGAPPQLGQPPRAGRLVPARRPRRADAGHGRLRRQQVRGVPHRLEHGEPADLDHPVGLRGPGPAERGARRRHRHLGRLDDEPHRRDRVVLADQRLVPRRWCWA